jgi:hypothetical protein
MGISDWEVVQDMKLLNIINYVEFINKDTF